MKENIKVVVPNITKEENEKRIRKLYDVCNEIFKDIPECFIQKKTNNS